MAEEVCRCVAKRMHQLPAYSRATAEEDSMSEEEDQHAPRRKKHTNSSIDRTGASMVVNKVTWPHKVVYSLAGKPASYQDISIPQFVLGYMI